MLIPVTVNAAIQLQIMYKLSQASAELEAQRGVLECAQRYPSGGPLYDRCIGELS